MFGRNVWQDQVYDLCICVVHERLALRVTGKVCFHCALTVRPDALGSHDDIAVALSGNTHVDSMLREAFADRCAERAGLA